MPATEKIKPVTTAAMSLPVQLFTGVRRQPGYFTWHSIDRPHAQTGCWIEEEGPTER